MKKGVRYLRLSVICCDSSVNAAVAFVVFKGCGSLVGGDDTLSVIKSLISMVNVSGAEVVRENVTLVKSSKQVIHLITL